MASATIQELNFTVLDVFTQTPFSGNQLAVVWDADGLTTEQMQKVAEEFGYSETSFVLRANKKEFAAHVRIFTPSFELPFAGHPTVGTAIALAEQRGLSGHMSIGLQLAAGPVQVTIKTDTQTASAEFEPPVLPHLIDERDVELGTVIGLEITRGVQRASAGTAFAFVELASSTEVDQAIISPGFAPFIQSLDVVGLFVFAREDASTIYARMFAPEAGVPEDPATGSAVAALSAVLWQDGNVAIKFLIHQGVLMGRPSQIGLALAPDNEGKLGTALVSGQAVTIMTGQIRV